jgi:GalNAc5-diNAcBac-PP-undecaprenol beta-1,3-glucosyltransferase
MKATIVIPTTDDRAVLVEQALWSIRRQTLQEYEIFLIGDGVAEPSREKFRQWEAEDKRLHFFDHPKHPRRGEEYRHAALQSARGDIITYLCDRDLYLPGHLERLHAALEKADFANSVPFAVNSEDELELDFRGSLEVPLTRRKSGSARSSTFGIPLSTGAHTLAAYRRLPEGWSTTPPDRFTDAEMWRKFLENPAMRCVTLFEPTVIYLPRGSHPGWPVADRLREMLRWRKRMEQPDFEAWFYRKALETALRSRAAWSGLPVRSALHSNLVERKRELWRTTRGRGMRYRLLALLADMVKP